MRCRRHDYRYALYIQPSLSYLLGEEDWQIGKIHLMRVRMHWRPTADVYETEDKIYLILELAGIDPEKLEIALYEDALVIEGQRYLRPVSKEGTYHMAEIRQGSFCFEYPLRMAINPDQIESHYENGLLSVIIKKHTG